MVLRNPAHGHYRRHQSHSYAETKYPCAAYGAVYTVPVLASFSGLHLPQYSTNDYEQSQTLVIRSPQQILTNVHICQRKTGTKYTVIRALTPAILFDTTVHS